MNPATAASIIGQTLVNNTIIMELVALLSPDQRALLRQRLQEAAAQVGEITEYEPDCSEYQRARFAELDQLLAPKP